MENLMSNRKTDVLIISDDPVQLAKQSEVLQILEEKIRVKNKVVQSIAGYLSASDLAHQFDILVINLSTSTANLANELDKLNANNLDKKALIFIGDQNNIDLLKIAISLGIKEFIDTANADKELPLTINKIHNEIIQSKNPNRARKNINIFMNAKGGAGASVIASNIAYALSKKDERVALIDLDMQFGSLGLNFDISPTYSISDAASMVNELDNISIESYMNAYSDNLKMLLPSQSEIVLPGEIHPRKIIEIISLLKTNYNQIILDIPRIIDPISSEILGIADNVNIVIQQSLAQYRDGRRLIHIMNKDLGISLNRINVIINRYDHKNTLTKKDIVDILHHDKVYCVRNDFELVAMASNVGSPLCESNSKSKIANELSNIAYQLGKLDLENTNQGVFGKIGSFFK